MDSDLNVPLLGQHSEPELQQAGRYWPHGLLFSWSGRILNKGWRRPLTAPDLLTLDRGLQPSKCSRELWLQWSQECSHSQRQPSLLLAAAKLYGPSYAAIGLLKLCGDVLNFAGPLLLNQLVDFLQGKPADDELASNMAAWMSLPNPASFGYVCVALLAFASSLKALLNTQYTYQQGRIACKLRAGLTCMVFKKTLLVGASDMAAFSSGAVQTLMSVDADRVVNVCAGAHELWSLPAQICIALYLLWTQVRGAFVAGLVVVLLLIPINRWLARCIEAASVGMMAHKDARIKATAELLRGVRQIKASAWEPPFLAHIRAARTGELQQLAVRKYLDALCVFFWATTSLLFSLGTFGAWILMGNELSASTAFTSLALFNVLIAPLNSFPWVVNGLVEAFVSAKRLQGFLALPEIKSEWAHRQHSTTCPTDTSEPTKQHRPEPGRSPQLSHRHSQRGFGSMFFMRGSSSTGSLGAPLGFGSGIDIARADSTSSAASLPMPDPATPRAEAPQLEVVTEVPDEHLPRPAIRVSLADATFTWVKEAGGHAGQTGGLSMAYAQGLLVQPTLAGISLSIVPGSLTVVTGSPGAGKSALLMALLGELASCQGTADVQGSVAYAAQDPWIMSVSIRENILFGRHFDGVRYADVLHACALVPDLRSMSRGDATCAGDRGAALSGGQRMRIALARAIYQDSDIYLLDDVLASVDAHVAAWLIDHAIYGPLLRRKTCIICTHSSALAQRADRVLHMRAGSIDSDHTPNGSTPPIVQACAGAQAPDDRLHAEEATQGLAHQEGPASYTDAACEPQDVGRGEDAAQAESGVEAERREAGHVKWLVHWSYMKATGWLLVCTILGSLLLMQATRNGSDLWLSYWVAHVEEDFTAAQHAHPRGGTGAQDVPHHPGSAWSWPGSLTIPAMLPVHPFKPPRLESDSGDSTHRTGLQLSWLPPETSFYFSVLVLIATANSAFTMVRAFSFAAGGLTAAQRLHQGLLQAVVQAPVGFFDATPTGRILNRFSSDTVLADDSLPFILNIFLANAAAIMGIIVVLLICQPLLVALFLPVGIIYKLLQSYYQATAREVRRLSSTVRSPVYSTFSEALAGAVTIRALGPEHMARLNEQQVAMLQRANFTALVLQQWLSLRLQCLAALVVTAVALLGVLQHLGTLPPFLSGGSRLFGAGAVGLSLSYALPLTGLLNGLLTSSSETEQEMVSVERILEYSAIQPEAAVEQPASRQHLPAWPGSGDVVVNDVWLRYKPDGPPALAGVSLHVSTGQKVGICGRTGAGKSSLLYAMLRLMPLERGAICIDGTDISHISLSCLRRTVAYIPQTPFLFEGTIRSNLDPMAVHSDRELIAVLKHVRLWDVLCGLSLSHAKGERAAPAAAPTSPRPPPTRLSINTSLSSAGTPPRSPRSPKPRSPTRMHKSPSAISPASLHQAAAGMPTSSNVSSAARHGHAAVPSPDKSPERRRPAGQKHAARCQTEPPSRRVRPPSPKRAGRSAAEAGTKVQGIPETLPPVLAPPPQPSLQPPHSPTSLACFCNAMWGRTLASEATAVLVHAGLGGQLLSLRLGEHGAGLSQGQQQLLAVARALLKRPRLVLLDECAASVDAHIARQVQELLHTHLADSSIVEVAHRMATVMACDVVAVLEAGRLIETGRPKDLLATPHSAFGALHAADQEASRSA